MRTEMTEITAPEKTTTTIEVDKETTDHMQYLPGVDPLWASQFIEFDQKFHHFYEATGFFFVTPRVVRIGVMRPNAIIGLLRREHQEYCDEQNLEETFEESMSMDWEAWQKPVKTSLPMWDLEQGRKCYLKGMTPMQAVQDIHVNSEDGHENDSVGGGTILLEPILVLMGIAMLIFGVISFHTAARDTRDHGAKTEPTSQIERSMFSAVIKN